LKIECIRLRQIQMPLVRPFETSFGVTSERPIILAEIMVDGLKGWGECVAGEGPFYSYESVDCDWIVLRKYLVPSLLGKKVLHPSEISSHLSHVKGYPMAKASLEAAIWDVYSQQEDMPLWKLLGGERSKIDCGVSIGIQPSIRRLIEHVDREVSEGYRKVKIKVKPGYDLEPLQAIRHHYPDIQLMCDANASYTSKDFAHLGRLDEFKLTMIEQPLSFDDLLMHARLQRKIDTSICLDESIRNVVDLETALELGSCRIVNIKTGRVGGHSQAIQIHDQCALRDVPVWCGGMLETGIGRAHNIALSTLPNFSLPGDVSASDRYFDRDVISPPVTVNADGQIRAPKGSGIGFEVDEHFIQALTTISEEFN